MLVNLFDNKARSQEQKTDEKASHYKDCDETGLGVSRQIGAIIKDREFRVVNYEYWDVVRSLLK
jgi:hypothetical protein